MSSNGARHDIEAGRMGRFQAQSVQRVIEVARRGGDGERSLWWEVSYDGGAMSAGGCVGEGETCEDPRLNRRTRRVVNELLAREWAAWDAELGA